MARVKRAVNAQKKRRSILEASSGYRGQRSRLYRKAKEQQLHSLTYAYRDRRARKGDFRKLWITRINAAARANDITYNRFIQGLRLARVSRSTARSSPSWPSPTPTAFAGLVAIAKAALAGRRERSGRGSGLSLAAPRPSEPRKRPVDPLTERTPRVVSAVKLLRAAERRKVGRFLVEGANSVGEALATGPVHELFFTEDAEQRYATADRPGTHARASVRRR